MMTVKDAFDPNSIFNRKLDADFPPQVLEWASKQGFGWKIGEIQLADGRTLELTWALLYWMAHWQPLAPTQAYEFERRFRPTGGPNGGPRNPNVKPWTRVDTERALKVADYPPGERPFLAEAAYYKPGLRQIREMHYYGSLPEQNNDKGFAEMREMYQDIGYDKTDATYFANTTAKYNTRRRARDLLNFSRSQVEQAWELGIIDDAIARNLLMQLEYTLDQTDAAVAKWKLALATKTVKKQIAATRKNYLLGDYTSEEAIQVLTQLGINAGRITTYLQLWDAEQRQWKLERTPQVLTQWLYLGVISEPEFRSRLVRVGYPESEVDRILSAAIAAKKSKPPADLLVPKGKSGRGGMAKSGELTKGEIRVMLLRKILTQQEADEELQALGLDLTDRGRLFKLWEGN